MPNYKNLKTDESKPFSIEEIPYEDTLNWTYDTTITELISKGYEPPIHDFFLTDLDGFDQTEKILFNKDISYIIVMHDLKGAVIKVKEKLSEVSEYATKENILFWCFTSSESSEIEKYRDIIPENIMSEIRKIINNKFIENKIKIPFPQMDVHMNK